MSDKKEVKGLFINKDIMGDVGLLKLSQKITYAFLLNLTENKKEFIFNDNTYVLLEKNLNLSHNTVKKNLNFLQQENYIDFYTKDLFGHKEVTKNSIKLQEYNKIKHKENVYLSLNTYSFNNIDSSSVFIPNEILLNTKLTLSDKIILSYVSSFANNTNKKKKCFTKIETIARIFKLSVMQVIRSLNKLESLKLITKTYVDKRGFVKKTVLSANLKNIKKFYNNPIDYINTLQTSSTITKQQMNNKELEEYKEQIKILINIIPRDMILDLLKQQVSKDKIDNKIDNLSDTQIINFIAHTIPQNVIQEFLKYNLIRAYMKNMPKIDENELGLNKEQE